MIWGTCRPLRVWFSSFFLAIGYIFTKIVWHVLKNQNKLTQSLKIHVANTRLLNHLLMIHINKEEIDIKLITSEFINVKDTRILTFGLAISQLVLTCSKLAIETL